LSRSDLILKHVPETKMGEADGLSRRLDRKIRTENNNNNLKLIKEEWI